MHSQQLQTEFASSQHGACQKGALKGEYRRESSVLKLNDWLSDYPPWIPQLSSIKARTDTPNSAHAFMITQ
eukprot:s1697_g7.t1